MHLIYNFKYVYHFSTDIFFSYYFLTVGEESLITNKITSFVKICWKCPPLIFMLYAIIMIISSFFNLKIWELDGSYELHLKCFDLETSLAMEFFIIMTSGIILQSFSFFILKYFHFMVNLCFLPLLFSSTVFSKNTHGLFG